MHKKLPTLSLPGAVVIAGLLIAIAIIITARPPAPANVAPSAAPAEALDTVLPISASDHIYGNPAAPITIIEYSDLDCPFCERFHETLEQLVAEYPNDVRWVYRHFPLSFHQFAYDESMIAECVGRIGGNQKFWDILPPLLSTPSSSSSEFQLEPLLSAAADIGISKAELQSCYEAKEFANTIDTQMANAAATGGSGTPWSIIVLPDGTYRSINGAQPYTVVKAMIDEILQN